jgi:glycosyltransferase involved in cell wall biosynthesis
MKKLCIVATIPAVVHAFLREQIQAAAASYDVTVVCNASDQHLLDGLSAKLVLLPIERKPSVRKDVAALLSLWRLFRRERFHIVHTHMPKTGLLGMLAAKLAGVPLRIHTFHGEVWATRTGIRRQALKRLDQLVSLLATDILTVSPSQRALLVKEGVVSNAKAGLIGFGSICGVDPARFQARTDVRHAIRDQLHIAREATVVLFLGRLNRDKGMLDLANAFNAVAAARPEVSLLLVGAQEDVRFSHMQEMCGVWRERLRYVEFTATPEYYMAAADIFCLPSYREGLPMTILEAAACGVPTVASRIYGITDAVLDGETGLLFKAGDVAALTQTLLALIADPRLRRQLGQAARRRTLTMFANTDITSGVLNLYDRLSARSEGT